MFQNADNIYHKQRKEKSESIPPIKGAVIVTQSKELAA
jgi:hypothetical protein